jgi:hypothetical protein
MGSEFEQIQSLMKYARSLEEKTMGKDFERYRRNAELLDECKKKKFPNLEKLGLINKTPQDDDTTQQTHPC